MVELALLTPETELEASDAETRGDKLSATFPNTTTLDCVYQTICPNFVRRSTYIRLFSRYCNCVGTQYLLIVKLPNTENYSNVKASTDSILLAAIFGAMAAHDGPKNNIKRGQGLRKMGKL